MSAASERAPVLRVEHLTVRLDGAEIVGDLSFSVAPDVAHTATFAGAWLASLLGRSSGPLIVTAAATCFFAALVARGVIHRP